MLNILKKRGGVCSCFTRLALLWEEFMEGRRRETSTVEAILILHCANIMPKSKPICVQQLHWQRMQRWTQDWSVAQVLLVALVVVSGQSLHHSTPLCPHMDTE